MGSLSELRLRCASIMEVLLITEPDDMYLMVRVDELKIMGTSDLIRGPDGLRRRRIAVR